MTNFSVRVHRIEGVREHPDADRLSIVSVAGNELVSNKREDGSYRYAPGDLAVYLPEGAILPEWLLKELDLWDEAKGKGILAGSKGNRVKMMRFRGIESRGALYKVVRRQWSDYVDHDEAVIWNRERDEALPVKEGDEVAEFLGVTEYFPA